MDTRSPCGGAPPGRHWIGDPAALCPVTEEEFEAAAERAFKEITKGVKKPRKGSAAKPHMIQAVGAPGAGKSTVADAFVRNHGRAPADTYAILDFDLMIEYHPRYKGMWSIPDLVTGAPTGVGNGAFFDLCIEDIAGIAFLILRRLTQKGYNIVLQSQDMGDLMLAKWRGYETTLLYVGVPLCTAQSRARKRAVETGKFLAETLGAQDRIIAKVYRKYVNETPWWAMWADEFAAVDNGGKAGSPLHFEIANPHEVGATWNEQMVRVYSMVKKVSKGADVQVPLGFS